ncbi:MAG: hypothetical protein M3Q48_06170 [Actinomycetota bacterium]|nr:hypothetical protein [Actinomycetota bacterium]
MGRWSPPWRERVRGDPPSPNGASSFHLAWALDAGAPLVEASAVLEVLVAPAVPRLYFWALQVSFRDDAGERGGAHLGLQWNAGHRGGTAVNWGGYDGAGRVLEGSASELPSTPHDPNTRDYAWAPGVAYRLRVSPSPGLRGWWQGEVTDLASGRTEVVRHLHGGGDRLASPMVWSEVFARCDHPSVAVRWSGLEARTASGERVRARAVRVNYQARATGGCDNTDVEVDGAGVVQRTNAERRTLPGAVIRLDAAPGVL